MKQIYLDIAGKKHSLYNNLIYHPPEGYRFISNSNNKKIHFLLNSDYIYSVQKNLINRIIPVNLVKSYLEKNSKFSFAYDLTYSSGHIVFRKEPWVVDLEYITHLSGYNFFHFKLYQKIIERYLNSENCKAIIPWTEAGQKTCLSLIKNNNILEKIKIVNLAVPPKNFLKNYDNKDKITFLFVTSVNIPKDFDIKGGKEVFEVFWKLNQEYDNLQLIVRAQVPKKIKLKYQKLENINIIDHVIPSADLELLFKSADVFLFPSYNTPGLILLDAMSYELPIITTDVWANSEMVSNNVNGLLIPKSKKINFFIEGNIPNWSSQSNLEIIKNHVDLNIVNNLYEKCKILIENKNLRETMGKKGRFEIENGKFSINTRNSKLKEIFDRATEK